MPPSLSPAPAALVVIAAIAYRTLVVTTHASCARRHCDTCDQDVITSDKINSDVLTQLYDHKEPM